MQQTEKKAYRSHTAQLPMPNNPTANTGQIHKHTQPICPKDGRTATLHSNTGDAAIADLACAQNKLFICNLCDQIISNTST